MLDKKISNSYRGAFALNKSKLVRVIDVIEKNFQKVTEGDLTKTFLTKFNNGKEATLRTIDEVFNLDNGIKNKVTELKITYRKGGSNLHVHFDGDREVPVINVSVEGETLQWSNESFAEIEEQTERTRESGWIYDLKSSKETSEFGFITMLIVTLAVIISFLTIPSNLKRSSNEEIAKESLLNKIDSIKTTEEKIDFIFEATNQIILEGYKPKQEFSIDTLLNDFFNLFSNWKMFLVIIPLLLTIGILYYIIKNCYWLYGFIWGDIEEEFEKIVERRKTLWNILFGSLILGILSNLFVFGLSGLL